MTISAPGLGHLLGCILYVLHSSLLEFGSRENSTKTVFDPESAMQGLYQDAYERFVRLGNALAEVFG